MTPYTPSDAEIEAAARAIWTEANCRGGDRWESHAYAHDWYKRCVRAALIAAASARNEKGT